MKKHRGLFLALGLAAMIGLMARESHAETMSLTVYQGVGTGGAIIYTQAGDANSVTASTTVATGNQLNNALIAHSLGAYNFGSLGGTSNLGLVGAINGQLAIAGTLTVNPANGPGSGSPITVVVTEDGFGIPPNLHGDTFSGGSQSNYTDASTNSFTTGTGIWSDSASPPNSATLSGVTLLGGGPGQVLRQGPGGSTIVPGSYTLPYSLTAITTISLSPTAGAGTAQLSINNNLLVTNTIPEPASIVMMLTGMPLPLVVLGLLRRRRAAA